MLLLIDAGNTRVKCAVSSNEGEILAVDVVEYAALSEAVLSSNAQFWAETFGFDRAQELDQAFVSSVAAEERNELIRIVCGLSGLPSPKFVKVTRSACGILNEYRSLDLLGVDRWVAAIGAADYGAVNRIIVDAGTAITVDLLKYDNSFQGGVILPGAKLMHDSLVGQAAGVFSKRSDVNAVLGKTTQECVNAGAVYGAAGAIDRVIDEMRLSCANNYPWQIFFCGGDSLWLSSLIRSTISISLEPNLIFNGLMNLSTSGEGGWVSR